MNVLLHAPVVCVFPVTYDNRSCVCFISVCDVCRWVHQI